MKEVKDIHFFGVEVSEHLTFLSDWVIICYLHNLNTKKKKFCTLRILFDVLQLQRSHISSGSGL